LDGAIRISEADISRVLHLAGTVNPVIKYSEAMHYSIRGTRSPFARPFAAFELDERGKRKYQVSSRPAIEMSIALARN